MLSQSGPLPSPAPASSPPQSPAPVQEEKAQAEPVPLPPRVELGSVVATPGALDALAAAGVTPAQLLARHQRGDWGDLDAHDRAENERSLIEGARLLSAYTLPATAEKIWIITEWDRSVTTLLLPGEY